MDELWANLQIIRMSNVIYAHTFKLVSAVAEDLGHLFVYLGQNTV